MCRSQVSICEYCGHGQQQQPTIIPCEWHYEQHQLFIAGHIIRIPTVCGDMECALIPYAVGACPELFEGCSSLHAWAAEQESQEWAGVFLEQEVGNVSESDKNSSMDINIYTPQYWEDDEVNDRKQQKKSKLRRFGSKIRAGIKKGMKKVASLAKKPNALTAAEKFTLPSFITHPIIAQESTAHPHSLLEQYDAVSISATEQTTGRYEISLHVPEEPIDISLPSGIQDFLDDWKNEIEERKQRYQEKKKIREQAKCYGVVMPRPLPPLPLNTTDIADSDCNDADDEASVDSEIDEVMEVGDDYIHPIYLALPEEGLGAEDSFYDQIPAFIAAKGIPVYDEDFDPAAAPAFTEPALLDNDDFVFIEAADNNVDKDELFFSLPADSLDPPAFYFEDSPTLNFEDSPALNFEDVILNLENTAEDYSYQVLERGYSAFEHHTSSSATNSSDEGQWSSLTSSQQRQQQQQHDDDGQSPSTTPITISDSSSHADKVEEGRSSASRLPTPVSNNIIKLGHFQYAAANIELVHPKPARNLKPVIGFELDAIEVEQDDYDIDNSKPGAWNFATELRKVLGLDQNLKFVAAAVKDEKDAAAGVVKSIYHLPSDFDNLDDCF